MEGQGHKLKVTSINRFFKPTSNVSTNEEHTPPIVENVSISSDQQPAKKQRVESDVASYVRLDPATRKPIWECPVNQRDEIRRAYILRGPYQPVMEYQQTKGRRFQKSWFEQFSWLEYSPQKEAAFCFPYFTFQEKEARYHVSTLNGFRSWKRVHAGKKCVFLIHVGGLTSHHSNVVRSMEVCYKSSTGRSCQQNDSIIVEHHYWFDVFNASIDHQVEELNSRFNDGAIQLLTLSSALEPRDNFKLFNVDDIYSLAKKFYTSDFSGQELHYLRSQLEHYEVDIIHHQKFQDISTISELCRRLVETEKAQHYHLIGRLICLVLILPVSTATTERSFSAMKLLKTPLRNKMEEDLLADMMVICIEREFTKKIDGDSIIDEFATMKSRRGTTYV